MSGTIRIRVSVDRAGDVPPRIEADCSYSRASRPASETPGVTVTPGVTPGRKGKAQEYLAFQVADASQLGRIPIEICQDAGLCDPVSWVDVKGLPSLRSLEGKEWTDCFGPRSRPKYIWIELTSEEISLVNRLVEAGVERRAAEKAAAKEAAKKAAAEEHFRNWAGEAHMMGGLHGDSMSPWGDE